jgi:hypothetical protein
VKLRRGSETRVGVSVRGNGVEDGTRVALAATVGEWVTVIGGFCSISWADGVQPVIKRLINKLPIIASLVR